MGDTFYIKVIDGKYKGARGYATVNFTNKCRCGLWLNGKFAIHSINESDIEYIDTHPLCRKTNKKL